MKKYTNSWCPRKTKVHRDREELEKEYSNMRASLERYREKLKHGDDSRLKKLRH